MARLKVTPDIVAPAAPAVTIPSVHMLLSDAYATLGQELSRLRQLSATEGLDSKHIESLTKMVKAISVLREEERAAETHAKVGATGRTASELTDAELLALLGATPTTSAHTARQLQAGSSPSDAQAVPVQGSALRPAPTTPPPSGFHLEGKGHSDDPNS